jgi:tyrosyl-tRNA synthetase
MSVDSWSLETLKQHKKLKFGTVDITPEDEFLKMLDSSIKNNKPLTVKCGIDPTGYDVHLGHLVPYKKMRQFQDLGHKGVVIIGDYTASVGDPTGKNDSRPPLSHEQIGKNAEKYMDQLFTVLDKSKTEVRFQSEWFSKVNLKDILSWAAQTTVAKLIGHDTFKNRLEQGHSLGLHEMFYPVLQGIDSVYIKADVELGGSDQRFNVLMGRDYQKWQGQRPQVAMLLPIITGTCGSQKMSKSLNNYIGILDEPFDKFGKIMSIPDALMLEYYQYILGVEPEEFEEIKKGLSTNTLHPNEVKKQLASRVVGFFHGKDIGLEMRQKFEDVFKKGAAPEDTPVIKLSKPTALIDLLVEANMVESKGEGKRLFKQNAVSFLEGDKISEAEVLVDKKFHDKIIKVGKRKFLKIIYE